MKFKYWCSLLQIAAMPFVMSVAHGSENEAALYAEHCKAAISFSGQSAPSETEALNIGFCLGMMDGLREDSPQWRGW